MGSIWQASHHHEEQSTNVHEKESVQLMRLTNNDLCMGDLGNNKKNG